MTHDHLATLLREDVAATEPAHPLDAMVPVRLGRRRLRSRRLGAAAATAAVLAVAGAVVPLASTGDDDAAPAGQTPGDQVRALLEPATGALPDPTVADGVSGTTYTFRNRHGGLWHDYRVTTSGPAAQDDPTERCRVALERGYVSCTVERGSDGTTAVVQVLAVVPVGEVPADSAELGPVGDNIYARVPLDRLDSVDPRDRFFRREVVVATPTGTLSVNEQLGAADQETAAAAYAVPVATLLDVAGELAARPEVLAPH
jgi:hypothetical protein